MIEQALLPIAVQPVISYPREAEVGKTYLMTIDLQVVEGSEWQFEEEEYPIYCMVESEPLFKCKALGESAIVLHRFGGTYGTAKFLMTATQRAVSREIKIIFVNAWGVPVREVRLRVTRVVEDNIAPLKETENYRQPTSKEKTANKIVPDELCPYQGLLPFERETARFFFGRDRVVSRLLENLEQSTFVPVIGASGSGKSSVVRAGLIPRLEESGWYILDIIKPGSDPISKLKNSFERLFQDQGQLLSFRKLSHRIESEGLRVVVENLPSRNKILLVIDQFEEVFTLCSNEADRRRFIEWLTQVIEQPSRLSIVTTMRADFLESCLNYRSLSYLIQDWRVLVLPMDEGELRAAIVEPAKNQGYQLEEELLDLILADVRQERNCLPLLQSVLTQLWSSRNQKAHILTLTAYHGIGQLSGAIAHYVESFYSKLDELEKEWVKQIFLKLTKIDSEGKTIRQRQPKKQLLELAPDRQTQTIINSVLNRLVDGRLFVIEEEGGEAWVDLAHEVLIVHWAQFSRWCGELKEILQLRTQIENAAHDWLEQDQKDDFLISRSLLFQVTREWLKLKPYLGKLEREFYQASQLNQLPFLNVSRQNFCWLPRSNKYALVIGVSQYEFLRSLPQTACDAEAIAQLLETHQYNVTRLPRRQISHGHWILDATGKLTVNTFIDELKTFLRDHAVNQDAVIYFAGHGLRVTNPMTDEVEGYLAVSDSATSGKNAIAISDLNRLIDRSSLSSLLMLFDCCYPGTLIEQRSLLKSTENTIQQKPGSNCLIATYHDFEVSGEGAEHGIFTNALLQGLSRDRTEDDVITSNSLIVSVEKELAATGQEVISAGRGRPIPIISPHDL